MLIGENVRFYLKGFITSLILTGIAGLQAQSCKVPFSVTFAQPNTTSMQITWSDANNMPEGWEIEIIEKGQTRTFMPSYPVISKKEFTLSGLKPSTAYELYIRTVCTQNSKSLWNVAIPFTTVLEIPTACQISIPLKDNGTEEFLLDVPEKGILGVNVFLQQVDLIIEHDWPADLKMVLQSPQGQRITLVSHKGLASDDFGNIQDNTCRETCSFSSQACDDIKNFNPPFTGLFRPEGTISAWRPDTLSKGYWKLIVFDRALKDIGTLKYLNLKFNKENCVVPEQFKATRIDATSATVTWKGAPNCNTVRLTASTGTTGDTIFINCKTGKYTFNNLKPGQSYCFTITSICSFTAQSQASCCLDAITTCAPVTTSEDFENTPLCLEGCGERCLLEGSIWQNTSADGGQDWIVWSGPTDTENTGPSEGQGNSDKFLYIENNPAICAPGKEVHLQSACMDIRAGVAGCDMSFYYHMFGADITSLTLEVSTNNAVSWEPVRTITGTQDDMWKHATVSLQNFTGKHGFLRFTALASAGSLGDIGLDRISFLGSVPVAQLSTYYKDADGDGYGREEETISVCLSAPPEGYAAFEGDCDDANPLIHPGSPEIPCNGIDENCNGMTDDANPENPIQSASIIQHARCNGSTDGSIVLTITGGQRPYNIQWNTGRTGDSLTNISAGIYQATITDNPGCIAITGFFEVKATNNISAIVSAVQEPSCRGLSDGAIFIIHSENAPPYSYAWSNGITTKNNEGIENGVYSVTVTDANMCSTSLNDIRLQSDKGVRAGMKQIRQPLCASDKNAVAELFATGGTPPYTYTWSNGGSGAVQSQLGSGQYACTVTDQKGCLDFVLVSVTAPPPIIPVIISTEDVRCHGERNGSIKTAASGGTPPYTFLWSHFDLADDVFNLAAGDYVLTVTDARGCAAATPVIRIAQPDPLRLEIDSINAATCLAGNNGFISVIPSGGNGSYNYSWNHSNQSKASFNDLKAGNYSVTAFDKLGCKASLPNISLPYVNKPVEAFILIQNTNKCFQDQQGAIAIEISSGKPPFNCNWSHGYIEVIGSGRDTLKNLASGNYRVTITDTEGCTGVTGPLTITAPQEIRYNVSGTEMNVCSGDTTASITLEVNGGMAPYIVLWNNGTYAGTNLQHLPDGMYQGEITDASGCKKMVPPITLEPVYNIKANAVITNDDNGASEGSVCLFPSGGLAPYTFDWSGPSAENCLKNLKAGFYSVTITDNAGCSKSVQFEVEKISSSESPDDHAARHRIYPNPASQEIMILPAMEGPYIIYNNKGAVVQTGIGTKQKTEGIHIENLNAGLYTLIVNHQGRKIPIRFIKL